MKIAIYIHQPACSVDSANGIIRALDPYYSFKLFSRDEVEDTFFDNVDMVCIPGGIGDADRFDTLMKYNAEHVTRFVQQGGKYLGICMGGYWAGKDYFSILKDIDCVQYIRRPNTDTRRPHPKAMPIKWRGQDHKMFFYDGCAMVGDTAKSQIIATYPNGDPMALIQNNVGVIGCHPESENYWYENYSWMRKETQRNHSELLLDFVSDLIKP